ncbi:MAG: methyltransferase domain-containing protein [Candidatus Lokiarchaeota archaeon]|nr:methyltransferase domain-containing protein [Candidatus Lokiarchaeota archaeon]
MKENNNDEIDKTDSHDKWDKYKGNEIPFSLNLFSVFYKYVRNDFRILDIGTGTGRIAIHLGERGYFVEGVDINKNGIRLARKESNGRNLSERVKFRVTNATNLAYEANSFHMVILQAVMTTFANNEDRNKVLQEVFRVLKPKGLIYLAVFGQTWHSELYKTRYLRDFPKTKEMGSFLCYDKETGDFEYIAHHYTEKELSLLLTENKFRILEFQTKEFITRNGNKTVGFVVIARKSI